MRRSPRLRSPPPRAPPPAPAPPPPPMVAPAAGGGGGDEQEPEPEPEPEQEEFVICNDDGFVYKVPSGDYTDAAPSSTQSSSAAGPDPVAAGLRRRRRALLRLRDKRLRQLSRWEALASELLAPLPAPLPPAPEAPPASPPPVAASASVLDDLLAQADLQAELLKRASQLCDEVNALCDAHEAAMVDGIATLPVWGDPRELMASLQSPDRQTDPGTSGLDEGNGGFQSLNSQQGERAIGVASTAVERVISGDKRIQSEVGDELPRPVLIENRKRKEALIPSSSNSIAAVDPLKSKRQKASGSKSTTPGTPGSTTRRKAANTRKTPDTSRSPGPTTRRRAAAQIVSPCSS